MPRASAGSEEVDKFQYLGAFVSNVGGGTIDLDNRLVKARATFVRMRNISNSSSIIRHTKMRLFKTLVKTVLMYGSETWRIDDERRRNETGRIPNQMFAENIEDTMARAD